MRPELCKNGRTFQHFHRGHEQLRSGALNYEYRSRPNFVYTSPRVCGEWSFADKSRVASTRLPHASWPGPGPLARVLVLPRTTTRNHVHRKRIHSSSQSSPPSNNYPSSPNSPSINISLSRKSSPLTNPSIRNSSIQSLVSPILASETHSLDHRVPTCLSSEIQIPHQRRQRCFRIRLARAQKSQDAFGPMGNSSFKGHSRRAASHSIGLLWWSAFGSGRSKRTSQNGLAN